RFGYRLWAYPGPNGPLTADGFPTVYLKTADAYGKFRNRYGGALDSEGSGNDSGAPKPGLNSTNRWRQVIQPGDTVRSLVLGADGGDPRIAAINDERSAEQLLPHPDYKDENARHAQILRTAAGPAYITPNTGNTAFYHTNTRFGKLAVLPANKTYAADRFPDIPHNIDGVKMSFGKPSRTGMPGDFDTGLGNIPDGAFTGKADEGNPVFRRRESYLPLDGGARVYYWVYPHPYFNWDYEETFDTFFTPNRQTPSAVVFGSLPLGKNGHWSTLLFSPFPAAEAADPSGKTVHPGKRVGFARDHLLLDLFNMPIVEPYAISEPFSTAGKVNMNYPMMPFANIERSTAFRAALHSVRVSAFPAQDSNIYKSVAAWDLDYNYRYPVNRDMTIRAFRDFFDKFKTDANAGLFKSASEICDRGLYPLESPSETVRAGGPIKYTAPAYNKDPDFYLKTQFWRSNSMTGDNMREKPYSDLYPRLTTKSNTYTVHVRAQALRQTTQSAEKGYWDEKKDRVIGEYRGSSTVERFIDPEDARFDPQNTTINAKDRIDVDKDSLEKAYRFRVINTKRFVP
ncbi:MAG: Verru_Chthon cassette protein A, partial [Bryobacteraceae bacterium]